MKFKVQIDVERCKGCELCVEACSYGILAMSKSLNSGGTHFTVTVSPNDCRGCLNCAIICPDAAIEIEQTDTET